MVTPKRDTNGAEVGRLESIGLLNGKLTLSIDQLVAGFLDGVEKFKELANKDTDLRTKFRDCIEAK